MAVELEPRPELIGTRMSQWMRRPAGAALPASSHSRRNARATRLFSSRGRPRGVRPFDAHDDAVALQAEAGLVPQVEREPQAVEARADVGGGRRDADAAARAGAAARGGHASSPYSVTSGSPPLRRPLRHLSTAHTTMTTSAATTA